MFDGIETLNVYWGAIAEQLISLGGVRLKHLTLSGLESFSLPGSIEFAKYKYVFSVSHMPVNSRLLCPSITSLSLKNCVQLTEAGFLPLIS
eukprot:gene37842-46694_t